MLDLIAYAIGALSVYLLVQAIRPLLESGEVTAEDWARIDDETSALLAQRDRLVAELQDLEFEAALNKVGAKDLVLLRADFEKRALDVEDAIASATRKYVDRIDADVDARLAKSDARKAEGEPVVPPAQVPIKVKAPAAPTLDDDDACAQCDAALAPDAKFCDECGAPRDVACPECDTPNRVGAKFCKGCGGNLIEEEVAS